MGKNGENKLTYYYSKYRNRLIYITSASGDHFKLIYYFGSPEYTKVFEEYLIMNEMGLIGNVGGTLGMFIGFSFTGVIAFIISFFKLGD